MSHNCPPQLHLELPPSTTSFKRSFDQFGFDLESPLGPSDVAGASASDGNDRNKRARSASSFSDDDRSIGSSSSLTLASGSSPTSGDSSTHDSHLPAAPRLPVPRLSLNIGRSPLEPPRLPTPEIQDIDMTDYPLPEPEEAEEPRPAPQSGSLNLNLNSSTSQAEENYRLSLERFNAFDTQIAALRRSRSPSLPRSSTPPPVLPPLELLGEEAPINTNSISFLHPPAQPSPPLPHSLYNYGPSRNQQPASGSRTNSRSEIVLDDRRRLPHETHTHTHVQPVPLAESSTASRDLTDNDDDDDDDDDGDSRTDEEWGRITQNVRSARRGTPWAFWSPAGEEGAGGGDDNVNEDDEEEEEEVEGVLEQPSSADIWRSPVPPILGELRSPSPLFNHLRVDDLDPQPPPPPPPLPLPLPPSPVLAHAHIPASLPRRADENAAPPTLPPIEDQVLSHGWDGPIEEVLDTLWNRYPATGERMPQPQTQQRHTQVQPPRLTIPIPIPSERERMPVGEIVSDSATTGSVSDVASPAPAPALAHAQARGHGHGHGREREMTFVEWYESEESSPLFEIHRHANSNRNANTNVTTSASTTAGANPHSHPTSTSNPTSASATTSAFQSHATSNSNGFNEAQVPPAVSPSILDTYAASRLQALQGIGTALEGIGQVLRESELTLAPYLSLRDGGGSSNANTNMNTSVGSTSLSVSSANATVGEASGNGRASRLSVRSSSSSTHTEGRTSAWRSTSGVSGEGNRQRGREEGVRGLGTMPVNTPAREPEYIDLDWSMPDAPSDLPPLADMTPASETETFRDMFERVTRRLPTRTETLRQRAVALEASVREMDERYRPERSGGGTAGDGDGDGDGDGQMEAERGASGLSQPLRRLFEPVEFSSSWDDTPVTSSTRRDRELPTNTSMLFDDGPSTSAFSNESQPATMRLAEQRARIDGLRESDTTSNLYNAAMDTLDLLNTARPSQNPGETSPERSHPPPGLRFVRRSFDHGESTPSDATSASSLNSRRFRFPTLDHRLDRTVREPPAEFLPVPSLPSPDLDFEFAPPASASNGSGVSEPHNDHRNFTIHPSRSEASYAASARHSPSPVFRRRFERSPPRRSSPPGFSRDFNPEAFAPGPFRNTVQSFWSARNNNRPPSRPRVSPTRWTAQAQPPSLVTPPSLPPLAFEEERRPSAQRSARSSGDLSSLYRNESGETSAAHLRAFLHRHPLPPPGYGDFLNQLDSPLDVLDRILTPQNNTTQSPPSSADLPSDDRNLFDTPSWLLDDDIVTLRRPATSSYRPPWRASHPPRPSTNPPSDLHNFLLRHPRTEAVRREASRLPPPLRGDEDGFNHAIEALRNDGPSTARSQEFSNRLQRDTSREPRTWASPSPSPWGILEQNQGSSPSRQTNASNDQLNGESHVLQRRRRHPPPADPLSSFPMDLDDDDLDVVSVFQDRARLFARRFRGPGGETPVFPRRIPTFMRSTTGATRRGRPLGDYVRDEDWNSDYESLLSLAAQLGEVKPRSTPAEVIDSLETGLYKDWKNPDSDHRCPICLDDYQPDDPVLKLSDCSHWLHRECLQSAARPSSDLRAERLLISLMKLVQAKGEVREMELEVVATMKVEAKAHLVLPAAPAGYHHSTLEGFGASFERYVNNLYHHHRASRNIGTCL
ncbi:hypothetical protein C0995_016688 [Termitomyces sp. Mi166|nr:hypothetical protein C0995_016688 [Termitomyces sp. Mi166\